MGTVPAPSTRHGRRRSPRIDRKRGVYRWNSRLAHGSYEHCARAKTLQQANSAPLSPRCFSIGWPISAQLPHRMIFRWVDRARSLPTQWPLIWPKDFK
jgi:hypothetical protein